MSFVSLFLSAWSSDLVRRRLRLDPGWAVVLSHVDHQRETVGASCALAARAGVAPGMTVAHARALLSGRPLHVSAHDEENDGRALRALAVRALRFTPVVAVDEPDGLLLNISGCDRLWGGARALAERLHGWAGALGFGARVAAAPTCAAAWGLARFAEESVAVVSDGSLHDSLAPLPVGALRLGERAVERLAEVGVERIGHLLDLPRAEVAARYGDEPLLRLDQAFGRALETLTPVRARAPVCAEREFDGPTDRIEAIEACARELLASVAGHLGARGAGCRSLGVVLKRSDLDPAVVRVRFSRPCRDAGHLWSLLRPRLAETNLGFGVEGVRVIAGGVCRLAQVQRSHLPEAPGGSDDAAQARLADTLGARLGRGRVLRPAVIESHAPERASRLEPFDRAPAAARGEPAAVVDAERPTLLLSRPSPVEVTLLLPEGPVVSVRRSGVCVPVLSCAGPERIEGEWWRGERSARDYYILALESGRWWWVFRESPGGGWFLHGEWA